MRFSKLPSVNDFFLRKWIDPFAIEQRVKSIKDEGKTVATLNGSFDLLHAGHLQMLYEASLQADVLIVLLNTDLSIQKYKSKKRPIVPLSERARMVAALEFADYVTCFDETDPRAVLEKIQPSVHVNGPEYGEDCIEAEVVKRHGGRIHIVSLVAGLSTSNLIKKIVDTCA